MMSCSETAKVLSRHAEHQKCSQVGEDELAEAGHETRRVEIANAHAAGGGYGERGRRPFGNQETAPFKTLPPHAAKVACAVDEAERGARRHGNGLHGGGLVQFFFCCRVSSAAAVPCSGGTPCKIRICTAPAAAPATKKYFRSVRVPSPARAPPAGRGVTSERSLAPSALSKVAGPQSECRAPKVTSARQTALFVLSRFEISSSSRLLPSLIARPLAPLLCSDSRRCRAAACVARVLL
jgi:hypothetical protein